MGKLNDGAVYVFYFGGIQQAFPSDMVWRSDEKVF